MGRAESGWLGNTVVTPAVEGELSVQAEAAAHLSAPKRQPEFTSPGSGAVLL